MRTRYSITYLISQAFKSLGRNSMMTVASVAVLLACLLVMGTFSMLVMNINHNLDQLGNMNKIVVYCNVDLTDEEVENVEKQIRSLDNVDSQKVEFVSKEQVLKEEREKYTKDNEQVFDIFLGMEEEGQNPYPDNFIITYEDADKVEDLEYELSNIEGVEKVRCRADLAESIESLKNGVILVFAGFLVILFLVSIFVIINTIKLAVFSRRQEISIMRYVGATRWFIATPFVFEGIIIGIFSSAIAFGIQWYAYSAVIKMLSADYSMLSFIPFDTVKWYILAGFAAVGIFTGIVGSMISSRKYLKA